MPWDPRRGRERHGTEVRLLPHHFSFDDGVSFRSELQTRVRMFGMPLLHVDGRHPTISDYAPWFDYEHLPEHLQGFSQECYDLAEHMLSSLPDSPQLALGLQKLLEAKDCFVRAAVPYAGAIAKSDADHEDRKQAIVDKQAKFERVTPENPMGVELPHDADPS